MTAPDHMFKTELKTLAFQGASTHDTMTQKEAYLAMFSFLEDYYNRTKSDEIGSMLSGMCLTNDGKPMDGAYWNEWEQAVQKSLKGLVDAEMRLSDGDSQSS